MRSVDPVPLTTGTTGDESGVDFYNVVITGPKQIITTADDNNIVCFNGLCRFSTPQLTPGSYTIQVKAVDRATNESSPATKTFRAGALGVVQNLEAVDSVFLDPVTSIRTVNTPNPKFRWNPPLELPSGLSTYEVAITGDATLPPGSQFNIPFTPFTDTNFFTTECFDGTGDAIGTGDQYTQALATADEIRITIKSFVPDGTHLLRVRVIPAAGVPGDSVPVIFTVDTTPPGTPALVAPEDNAFVNTGRPTFDWAASTGDAVDYRLQVIKSGDTFQGPFVINSGDIAQTQFQPTDILADATYRWRVIASDNALNTASSLNRTFTVDTVKPGQPVLIAPPDKALINTRTVSFEWSAATEDVDVIDYRLQVLNAQGFVINKVVATTQSTADLTDGAYLWRVIARDRALNIGFSLARTFTVDTLAPGAPTLVSPADNTLLSTNTPLFEWTASTGDVDGYRIQVVKSTDTFAGPFVINSGGLTQTQFRPTGDLAENTYRWRVIASDQALNTASSVTRTFTIALARPLVDLRLEPDFDPRFPLGVGATFKLTVKVEITGDQSVSAIDAFLVFDPQKLQVMGVIGTGDGTMEQVLVSTFDNIDGTVLFSATTLGPAPTGNFVLAVVTFEAREPPSLGIEEGTTVDFDQATGRRTAATFKGVSVLRTLVPVGITILKPTVDILLTSEFTHLTVGGRVPVTVKVQPNGQGVSTVETFLKFDPRKLQVVEIGTGDGTLEEVLTGTFNNIEGTVRFSATTLGPAPTGDFVLAVVTFWVKEPASLGEQLTTVSFDASIGRNTEASSRGVSVLKNLKPAEFTILKPTVDISLTPDFTNFRTDELAPITIKVAPNGQRVSTVDVSLVFDPQKLQVVGDIGTGDGSLDAVLVSFFNNDNGTILFSATTSGIAPTSEFALAVATF